MPIAVPPPWLVMNAMRFPSGDQRTFVRSKSPKVSGSGSPPSAVVHQSWCHCRPA
jgi:hypothetical protein